MNADWFVEKFSKDRILISKRLFLWKYIINLVLYTKARARIRWCPSRKLLKILWLFLFNNYKSKLYELYNKLWCFYSCKTILNEMLESLASPFFFPLPPTFPNHLDPFLRVANVRSVSNFKFKRNAPEVLGWKGKEKCRRFKNLFSVLKR